MAELGHLRYHQGIEEPALRCRAPPEGRGEPGSTPGGVGDPGGPRIGPPGRDLGGIARPGAGVAGFPGREGSAPRHRRAGQCLAAPGPAHRPQPLALPPDEPATAAAPAPTQTEAQMTAKPKSNGPTPSRPSLGRRTASTGGWKRTDGLGRPPRQAQAPRP